MMNFSLNDSPLPICFPGLNSHSRSQLVIQGPTQRQLRFLQMFQASCAARGISSSKRWLRTLYCWLLKPALGTRRSELNQNTLAGSWVCTAHWHWGNIICVCVCMCTRCMRMYACVRVSLWVCVVTIEDANESIDKANICNGTSQRLARKSKLKAWGSSDACCRYLSNRNVKHCWVCLTSTQHIVAEFQNLINKSKVWLRYDAFTLPLASTLQNNSKL